MLLYVQRFHEQNLLVLLMLFVSMNQGIKTNNECNFSMLVKDCIEWAKYFVILTKKFEGI